MRPWERNSANLFASLSFYGPAESLAGVRLITSRVAYSVFNIALLADPVADIEGEIDRRIQLAGAHYQRFNRQWSFWICEDLLGTRTSRRLMRIFESHGLHCIADSPGMEADDLPAPRRSLPKLDYRLVGDAATRRDFSCIVAQCFHIPASIAHIIYEGSEPWNAPLEIWLGYHEGQPVTSAAVIDAAGSLGIYSVATMPQWRGKGMAEAIMRHAITDIRSRGAHGPLVLQSSPAGLDLYRRLGFRRVTRYFVFATS